MVFWGDLRGPVAAVSGRQEAPVPGPSYSGGLSGRVAQRKGPESSGGTDELTDGLIDGWTDGSCQQGLRGQTSNCWQCYQPDLMPGGVPDDS